MRKIALLSDYISGSGGTEYYTSILAKNLKQEGNDVRVYTGAHPKSNYWSNLLANCGISTFSSDLVNNGRDDRKPERATVSMMLNDKEWQPDLVHANPFGKMAVEWILSRSGPVPIVATEWTIPSAQTEHWYQPETAEIINEVSVMIATCEASAKGLKDFFDYKGRCEVVPHLVERPKIITQSIGNRAIESIACTARLVPEKGQDFLLAGFADVLKEYPDITLHLYGDGRDRDHLEDAAQSHGIKKSTFFHGQYETFVGIDQIAMSHDIFVQPSLFESIPTTILELAARKRSSIASDVGGISEFIESGHNGIIIPKTNPSAIARAIINYCEHPETLSAHQERSRDAFIKKYDNAENLRKIMRIYEEIS